jgi:hypothetical protein
MTVTRRVLPAILGVALAACGAGAAPADPAPQPTAIAQVMSPPVTAVPAVTPEPTTKPPTPKPTPKATPAPPPPRPSGVKFVNDDRECVKGNDDDGCLRAKYTQTVLWKAPRSKGVEIRIFGVIGCPAIPEHPKPGANGPCLVKGTELPSSVRTLLAKAPASAGWVSWSWTQEEAECDPYAPVGIAPDGRPYDAVVVQAFNAQDRSSFAIAEPGRWDEPGEGDMVC